VRTAHALGALAIATLLAACGDAPQTLGDGANRPQTVSHQGQGGAHQASGWTNGDKASWEAHLRARTQGQNEYARTAVH
jgi:hypothetical protein